MKTGAVIVAAGTSSYMEDFKPMLKIDGTTVIKRIITTLKQADVEDIVVVTGDRAEKLEKHISHMGVICMRNERFFETEMLDSVIIGLKYLNQKCNGIFLVPVDIPLFSERSLGILLNNTADILIPTYNGKEGHPVLISSGMIPLLLSYHGTDGLRGAIEYSRKRVMQIPVEDEGILLHVNTENDYEKLKLRELKIHKAQELFYDMQLTLSKEKTFFGPGTAEFLMLVEQTGSMQTACRCMNMSYSKAWKMVNLAEEQLGFSLLIRHAGGQEGGSSELTEEGKEFVKHFIDFQSEAKVAVKKLFKKYFTYAEE